MRLSPHQWFEQPSIMTLKGGFWERKLGPSGNPEEDDAPPSGPDAGWVTGAGAPPKP
jgi:hypothetical protein